MYEGYLREALIEAEPETSGNQSTGRYSFRKRLLLESTSLVHSPLDITLFESIPDSTPGCSKLRESCPRMEDRLLAKEEQLRRYPASQGIRTMDCHVNKGDALWLPSFWWHEVISLPGDQVDGFSPLNIAVNLWFDPLFRKEFPCKECDKSKINQIYGPILRRLLREGTLS
jgi:hypothetical protein